MDFLKEMELTTKIIKQYATTHKCNGEAAAEIFKLTAARLTAEKNTGLSGYLSQVVRALENM